MLEQIAEAVWSVSAPLKVGGLIALNTRMTIVRLANGDLWLHSVIPISPELQQEVDGLGTVRHLVAPSCLHHLFVGEWMAAYPEAQSYAAKGLEKKRPELPFSVRLGSGFHADWLDEIDLLPIEGMPSVNEVVFYHRASQTLIATDLFFYLPEAEGMTHLYALLNGFKHKMKTPALYKFAIKNKPQFLLSLTPLRSWPIRNVVMCHHHILQDEAQAVVQQELDALDVPST